MVFKVLMKLKNVPKGDVAEIIVESVQRMTEPGWSIRFSINAIIQNFKKNKTRWY